MVGGADYATSPFNLATQGQRQPGSTFKPFALTAALLVGHLARLGLELAAEAVRRPAQRRQRVLRRQKLRRRVLRLADALASATTISDNSVYAEVGVKVGTRKIARVARRLGIRTPISTNYAMILGGLQRRRHAARHGARLRDVRDRRQAHLEPEARRARQGPDRHPPRARRRRQGAARATPKTLKRTQVIPAERRRRGHADPADGRRLRHRQGGGDPRLRRRQDRHDRELRRRLVRRLERPDDGRDLGRLPGQTRADADAVRRRAGRRRHLPGAAVARLHGRRRWRSSTSAPRWPQALRDGEDPTTVETTTTPDVAVRADRRRHDDGRRRDRRDETPTPRRHRHRRRHGRHGRRGEPHTRGGDTGTPPPAGGGTGTPTPRPGGGANGGGAAAPSG